MKYKIRKDLFYFPETDIDNRVKKITQTLIALDLLLRAGDFALTESGYLSLEDSAKAYFTAFKD